MNKLIPPVAALALLAACESAPQGPGKSALAERLSGQTLRMEPTEDQRGGPPAVTAVLAPDGRATLTFEGQTITRFWRAEGAGLCFSDAADSNSLNDCREIVFTGPRTFDVFDMRPGSEGQIASGRIVQP